MCLSSITSAIRNRFLGIQRRASLTLLFLVLRGSLLSAQLLPFFTSPQKIGYNNEETIPTSPYRKWIDLQGSWKYSLDMETWESISIPSAYRGQESVWFKRAFDVAKFDVEHLTFRFIAYGINYYCEIYINEQFLGKHSGTSPFHFRIPDYALKEGSNTIRIFCRNRLAALETVPLAEQLYDPSNVGGIFRAVGISVTSAVWTQDTKLETNITGDGKTVSMNYTTILHSGSVNRLRSDSVYNKARSTRKPIEHYFEIIDQLTGNVVFRSEAKRIEIETDRAVQLQLQGTMSDVRLWSTTLPTLYTLREVTTFSGKIVDEFQIPIGFRKIETRKKEFYLNAEKIFLKAITYREFSPDHGGCPTPGEVERDIILMKNLGANAVRVLSSSINPFFLSLCDRYGLLVLFDLPLWKVPSTILNEISVQFTARNVFSEFYNEYNLHPSLIAWGLASGIDANQAGYEHYLQNALGSHNRSSNHLLYASFAVSIPNMLPKEIDFGAIDIPSIASGNVRTILDQSKAFIDQGDKPIVVGMIERQIQIGNNNGHSDPRSLDAQGQFYLDIFPLVSNNGFAGIIVHSFSDWMTGIPILNQDLFYQYFSTSGLVDQYRQKRIAYDVVKALYNNEKPPALVVGTYSESIPSAFVIAGLFILFVFAVVYNLFRRFRENVLRSFLRPYNFYVDIRDQRILSVFQTSVIALLGAVALGLFSMNLLYHWKSSYWFDFYLTQFVRIVWIKEWIHLCATYPLIGILIVSGVIFIGVLFYTFLIKLISLAFRKRILLFDAYSASGWSLLPVLLCAPIGMILHRMLDSPVIEYLSILTIVVFLIWILSRLFKGTAILFTIRPLYLYIIGSCLIVVAIVLWGYSLQESGRIFDYLRYAWDVSSRLPSASSSL